MILCIICRLIEAAYTLQRATGFSCAKKKKRPARKASGPERHPFDSAEPSTLLIPKHPEFGCFADWFLWDIECFKCSDWITVTIGAWSGHRWFESDKDQMQTIQHASRMFLPFGRELENWKYQMAVRTIANHRNIWWCGGNKSAEQKEGIVNYIQRKDILAVLWTGYGKSLVITAVPVTTRYMQCIKEGC